MEVIPFGAPGFRFDFKREARNAAVNEACEGHEDAMNCTTEHLCSACEALAVQIEHKLQRAFVAGQASMSGSGD